MAGSLSLVLLVGALLWVALREDRYVAPPPSAPRLERADAAAAGRVLGMLVEAVAAGDVAAAQELAGDEAARALLAAVVENARELRVRDLALRYVDQLEPLTAAGTWAATVETTWRFEGFDEDPATTEVRFGFRADGSDVKVVSIGGEQGRSPLWLVGPLEVRRTPQTLVLATDEVAAARYARLARAAVPVVRRVLRAWEPRLVVEVPTSSEGLDRALGATPGTYAGIAAVTTSVDGSLEPAAPVHVLVNPEEMGRLERTGAQVVMSHEATHVATGASRSGAPIWLLEGFADYVALRDVPLPVSTTAAQVIEEVQREGVPCRLPTAAEFDVESSHLGAVYESAWLVCTVLAEEAGEQALVDLYAAVDAGEDVGTALRRLTPLTEARLVRAWQDRLRDLAA